jgi:hypothetical protein
LLKSVAMDKLPGQTASRGEDNGAGLPCIDNSLLPLLSCRCPIVFIAHPKLFTPHSVRHCEAQAGSLSSPVPAQKRDLRQGEGELQMTISYFYNLFKQDKTGGAREK